MYLVDSHTHSISPDAGVPMERMCQAALNVGLDELVITDHFELYNPVPPRLTMFNSAYLRDYWDQFQACQDTFRNRLTISFGIELGQSVCNPAFAKQVLQEYPFDYVIGSVHKLQNRDLSEQNYSREHGEQVLRENLDLLWRMADEGDFDCLGHIDLIRRYSGRAGREIHLLQESEQVRRILSRLIARGKGLEINTSEVRRGGRAMPDREILSLYRMLGGEIVTYGSDAHRPQDVGADLAYTVALAKEAGFDHLTHFRQRKPIRIPI